ncbi:MAG TPA: hypothetical protein VK602_11545 [Phyllobacterium sp.]|nr:hypothetical protein [Phyllobacterium sp.]
MNRNERLALRMQILKWREIAERVGPQHILWDFISDAEALLDGRETILGGTPDEVYAKLMEIRP